MKPAKFIVIGFRGAGKSTVAHLVSKAVGIPLVDLDERLTARARSSLPDFIERNGEELFRNWEAEELERALREPGPFLLVTGGGIVESEVSRELLKMARDPKILLHCEQETLWERLQANPDRLRVGKLESFSDLKRLWERRMPKFRDLATFSVDSNDLNKAADEVAALLSQALS